MTPKRYLVFGVLAVAIQGGVIASQPAVILLQASAALSQTTALSSNAALSQNTALSLNTGAASKRVTLNLAAPSTATPDQSPTLAATQAETVAKKTAPKAQPLPVKKPAHTKPRAEPLENKPLLANKISQGKPSFDQVRDVSSATKPLEPPMEQPPEIAAITSSRVEKAINTASPNVKTSSQTSTIELASPSFATPPPQPNYPRIARKKGLEGTATIEVMFNELGEQLTLTLVKSSGFSLLDQAAIEAVEAWQFAAPSPTLASHYRVRVPIRFALN